MMEVDASAANQVGQKRYNEGGGEPQLKQARAHEDQSTQKVCQARRQSVKQPGQSYQQLVGQNSSAENSYYLGLLYLKQNVEIDYNAAMQLYVQAASRQ